MPAKNIVLSPFRSGHLDRVMAIERASFGRLAYTRGMFLDLYRHCGPLFLVARRGRLMAGYAVACREGREAEIVSIAVALAFRGQGVGTALMERLLDLAAAGGASRVRLMVRTDNQAAIRFYRGFGFRRARRVARYYEDGADGYRMVRAF